VVDVSETPPRVTSLSWGSIETEDGSYRDAKCWPGGSRGWDWNETGTSHTPGIQVADVKEVVERGAETVILSRGQNRRLQVKDETLDYLESLGVDVEILETSEAVERYNELAEQGEPAGGLFHSTC
jgi:hypothetical protein